ncbi:hypothetical protein ACFL3P_05125 [Pseudomonadota bacterium]
MKRSIMLLKRLMRECTRAVVATVLVTGVALVISIYDSTDSVSTVAATDDGWGSESLSQAYSNLPKLSPISLANACGLGASSCFKCHNGKRAGAANMDSEKAPWHSQHAKVNNSCAGCHQGNPRLMKEKMAHNRMLADPRTDLEKACSTCHAGKDLDELNKSYMSLQGEK